MDDQSGEELVAVDLRGLDGVTFPVNGLRHEPDGAQSGWFIWVGERDVPQEDDAFSPLHGAHLVKLYPAIEAYLALPPGSRFLWAPGYEDTWHDPQLLR